MVAQQEASLHKVLEAQESTRIYGALAQRHPPLLEYQLESIALLFRIITDVMRPKAGRLPNRVQSRCKVSTRISCVMDNHRAALSHKQVGE